MKTIKSIIIVTIFLFTNNNVKAQVSVFGNGGGAGAYDGWNLAAAQALDIKNEANLPINFYTNAGAAGFANLRMFIDAAGAGAASGYIGIGNNFVNPVSRLHIHQESNATTWFQMTGNNTGRTAMNGLRIGVLNVAGSPFDVEIRQQENAPMKFFTGDGAGTIVQRERFRLFYGNGGDGAGGWNNTAGVTKAFLVHDGNPAVAGYLPPSVAMLNVGRVTGASPSGGNRSWMDVGTYYNFDSDNMYTGLMDMGSNRKDAVVNFGDDPQFNSGDQPVQNLRFIFTEYPENTTTIDPYDGRRSQGLEIARMSAQGNMGIGALFVSSLQPVRRLEIVDDGTNPRGHTGGPQLRLSSTQSSGNILTTGVWTDLQTTSLGDLYIHPSNTNVNSNVGVKRNI